MLVEHTHLKMYMIIHDNQINQKDGALIYPPPFHKDSASSSSSTPSSGTKISPAVLFIIVILAVLFFISGLLHLLVRFLIKHPSSSSSSQNNRYPEISGPDALQRQLQQLFHLHDSGLDQAFIDALPVFLYKEIMGLKEPFDCAVCLCEFSEKDKLRLLPMCSHAFHINCIDTWLLSNSTCPLCRNTLFTPGFSIENPIFEFDDSIEEDGCHGNGDNRLNSCQKTIEVEEISGEKKGVLPVRLGKFKRVNEAQGETYEGGETSSSNLDARRCYSMGSFQYVVNDSNLLVPLTVDRRRDIKIEKEIRNNGDLINGDLEGKKISSVSRGDSFSVSKIWLWSKKGRLSNSSESHIGIPSLQAELPWTERKQGV